jgi:hypothetical protein
MRRHNVFAQQRERAQSSRIAAITTSACCRSTEPSVSGQIGTAIQITPPVVATSAVYETTLIPRQIGSIAIACEQISHTNRIIVGRETKDLKKSPA